MAHILLGGEVAYVLTESLSQRVVELKQRGVDPLLAIVRLGEEPAALLYEEGASKHAERIGVKVKVYALAEDANQADIEQVIVEINQDDSIHGCLVFSPLPSHIDEKRIANLLAPDKDVDASTEASLAGVFKGEPNRFAPCTAEAAMAIIDYYNVPLSGARVVVLGRSLVVGKPVAMLLLNANATVTICHSKTKDSAQIAKEADILVTCTGQSKMVTAEFTNPDQIIIDVGINVDENGKVSGDADFENIEPIVKAITPVQGGVGSVTVSVLIRHVVEAAERACMCYLTMNVS